MYYSEIREFDLKLSGKSGNYQGISFHELVGNPALNLGSSRETSIVAITSQHCPL